MFVLIFLGLEVIICFFFLFACLCTHLVSVIDTQGDELIAIT